MPKFEVNVLCERCFEAVVEAPCEKVAKKKAMSFSNLSDESTYHQKIKEVLDCHKIDENGDFK